MSSRKTQKPKALLWCRRQNFALQLSLNVVLPRQRRYPFTPDVFSASSARSHQGPQQQWRQFAEKLLSRRKHNTPSLCRTCEGAVEGAAAILLSTPLREPPASANSCAWCAAPLTSTRAVEPEHHWLHTTSTTSGGREAATHGLVLQRTEAGNTPSEEGVFSEQQELVLAQRSPNSSVSAPLCRHQEPAL